MKKVSFVYVEKSLNYEQLQLRSQMAQLAHSVGSSVLIFSFSQTEQRKECNLNTKTVISLQEQTHGT